MQETNEKCNCVAMVQENQIRDDQEFFLPNFYEVDLFLVLSWYGDMSKILKELNPVCYFTPDIYICILSFTSHDNSKGLIL